MQCGVQESSIQAWAIVWRRVNRVALRSAFGLGFVGLCCPLFGLLVLEACNLDLTFVESMLQVP